MQQLPYHIYMEIKQIRWRCKHADAKGDRCEADATRRIHFRGDHPFDYTDVCEAHRALYKHVVWDQSLIPGKEYFDEIPAPATVSKL